MRYWAAMPKGIQMDDMSEDQSKLIQAIIDACQKLGWAVALPTDNISERVDGMIIGTEDYITSLIGGSDEHMDFISDDDDIFDELDEEDILHSNVDLKKAKKQTH